MKNPEMSIKDNVMLALRLQEHADKAVVDRTFDYTSHEAERKAATALFKLVEAQANAHMTKLVEESGNV